MRSYAPTSAKRLATCSEPLRRLFTSVLQDYDHVIICGRRDRAAQEAAFAAGNTKLHYPNGNHNAEPESNAVDAAPYDPRVVGGVDWGSTKAATARFYHFAGFVKCRAQELGIRIRWGGDWDGDLLFDDQTFNDLVHFEILR